MPNRVKYTLLFFITMTITIAINGKYTECDIPGNNPNKTLTTAVKEKKRLKSRKRTTVKTQKQKTGKPRPDYQFGYRILKRGDTGSDVKYIAVLLVNHLYLKEQDIIYTDNRNVVYEGEIINAIKQVQQQHGLGNSGIIDSLTYDALKKISQGR